MSGLCRLVGHLLPQTAFLPAKTWPESQILIFWENVQLLKPHIHSDIYTVALIVYLKNTLVVYFIHSDLVIRSALSDAYQMFTAISVWLGLEVIV